ncbi:hypothetical protein G6F63_016674 [Rhizopus arrhizus]|nr:hypothetical protein G6F63_016674 [Rhizopus arrhizus]
MQCGTGTGVGLDQLYNRFHRIDEADFQHFPALICIPACCLVKISNRCREPMRGFHLRFRARSRSLST